MSSYAILHALSCLGSSRTYIPVLHTSRKTSEELVNVMLRVGLDERAGWRYVAGANHTRVAVMDTSSRLWWAVKSIVDLGLALDAPLAMTRMLPGDIYRGLISNEWVKRDDKGHPMSCEEMIPFYSCDDQAFRCEDWKHDARSMFLDMVCTKLALHVFAGSVFFGGYKLNDSILISDPSVSIQKLMDYGTPMEVLNRQGETELIIKDLNHWILARMLLTRSKSMGLLIYHLEKGREIGPKLRRFIDDSMVTELQTREAMRDAQDESDNEGSVSLQGAKDLNIREAFLSSEYKVKMGQIDGFYHYVTESEIVKAETLSGFESVDHRRIDRLLLPREIDDDMVIDYLLSSECLLGHKRRVIPAKIKYGYKIQDKKELGSGIFDPYTGKDSMNLFHTSVWTEKIPYFTRKKDLETTDKVFIEEKIKKGSKHEYKIDSELNIRLQDALLREKSKREKEGAGAK